MMKNKAIGKGVVISVVIVVAWVALALMTGTRGVRAATFTVLNLSDSGAGSLRQAILDANATPGLDMISFQAGLTGTITLVSALPTITGDVTIQGPGANVLTVSAPAGTTTIRIFDIIGSNVSISGLTMTNGNVTGLDPSLAHGGIIFATNATVTLTNCAVLNGRALQGGGIEILGNLTLAGCTVAGNVTTNAAGGGLLVFGPATLSITNSTISGNQTVTTGGAMAFINPGVTATIVNSTITANTASNGVGGIFTLLLNPPPLTLKNTIVAGNTGSTPDINLFTSAGSNLIGNNTGTTINMQMPSDLVGTGAMPINAMLGPLQNNGGPTETHALLTGSPAINAVVECTDVANNPVTTDQRGVGRPQGPACDRGSFELCSITCPANITVSNDSGSCGAVVKYSEPAGTQICGTVSCAPAPGSLFNVGTTTVTCTLSNGGSCSFTVTVNDTQPPTITCPANITVGNDPNQCSAVVNYTTPTASDNCGGATTSCSPASGSIFPVGTTTVTCTATDSSGNTGTCSFTITVNDTQPPTITCPANITVSNDPNQCSAVVNYTPPTPIDNCGVKTSSCLPAPGSAFPVGTTTVTCAATDSSGNTGTCSFTITVNDTQPPAITCPANVTAVAAQTCPISSSATVTFPPPTVSDNCPGVTSSCSPPSGSIFPVGTTTVTCTATDASGNTASCSFTVTVFSGCLQDDSNPANAVLFNAVTGEYRFCCGGTTFPGVGTVLVKGCTVTIQHYPANRRVLIKFDGAVGAGTASLQSPPGTIRCTVTDRNTRNNTCACQ